MLYDLQQMDLSAFNVRKVPYTDGLREQMLYSLQAEKRWWYEELKCADIWNRPELLRQPDEFNDLGISGYTATYNSVNRQHTDISNLPPNAIRREVLQLRFRERCGVPHYGRGAATSLGIILQKILPKGYPLDFRLPKSEKQPATRYYILPPIEEARRHFVEMTGLQGVFEECAEDDLAAKAEAEAGFKSNLSNLTNLKPKLRKVNAS